MKSAVAASLLASAQAGGNVNLAFSDCGDASTVGTIKDLEPKSLTLGATTTIIGSGSLTQDVPGGDFSFTAKALGVTVLSDSGDLCADKSIALPLGVGTFDYKSAGCPIKAGDVSLTFDATLAGSIPSQIAKLDIEIDAKATDGTKALCAEINTSPGANLEQSSAGGKVDLAFSDCGDASTVGTIKDLEPKSLTLGATTTIVGSGSLTQDVPGGDFSFTAKALGVTVLSDSGDLCADKSIALPLGVGTFDYKSAGCPIKAGDVSLTFDATLAGSIPSQIAKLDIEIDAKATDGTKALCAEINTSPGANFKQSSEGGNVNLAFSDCGDASTVGTIKDLEPKSLTLGATTTIVGSGSLTQDVPGGDFSFTAKALGVTVLSDSGDLCTDKSIALPLGVGTFDYKSAGCPIKAGDVSLTFDATLAGSIPSQIAKLDIEINAKATDGTKALCAEINTSPGQTIIIV